MPADELRCFKARGISDMHKQFPRIIVIAVFFFGQSNDVLFFREGSLQAASIKAYIDFYSKDLSSTFVVASQKKETGGAGSEKEIDGLKIMTMVSKRERGEDYIIAISSVLTSKGSELGKMMYTEKRKNYGGKNGFIYKSVTRYSYPPNNRVRYLIWNYKDKKNTFWYFFDTMRDAKRTINVESFRPPAESDFSILDYIDVNLEEETHKFLRSEKYDDKICYVVESIPLKKHIKYGKRISWIDQNNWIPLKIDYFDKKRALWKTLNITWQKKSDLWFWKKAVAVNVQNDYTTLITIEGVKVNVGLNDREFTTTALKREKF